MPLTSKTTKPRETGARTTQERTNGIAHVNDVASENGGRRPEGRQEIARSVTNTRPVVHVGDKHEGRGQAVRVAFRPGQIVGNQVAGRGLLGGGVEKEVAPDARHRGTPVVWSNDGSN